MSEESAKTTRSDSERNKDTSTLCTPLRMDERVYKITTRTTRDTAMPTKDEYIQGRLRMSPFIRHRQAGYEGVLRYAPQSRHLPCTTFLCFTSYILVISNRWTFHMDIPLFPSFSLCSFSHSTTDFLAVFPIPSAQFLVSPWTITLLQSTFFSVLRC